jgi:hypothetical protein
VYIEITGGIMPARKFVGRLVAFIAGILTFVLLSRNGPTLQGLLAFIVVTAVVWLYFAWCEFHAKRETPDEWLDDERQLLAFRRHHVLCTIAAIVGAVGTALLLVGLYMWAANAGIHFRYTTPNRPLESKRWHHRHHEPISITHHFDLSLWWLPFLLGLLTVYLACYIWQNWKYATIAVTSKRLIQQRSVVYYMPWLKSYFNQTPYEQVVDTDNKATYFGDIGHWWGRVVITWRLQKGSVTQENRKIILDFIPNYKHVAGVLRNAVDTYDNPTPVVVQADTVVTTTDDSTTEIQPVPIQETPGSPIG